MSLPTHAPAHCRGEVRTTAVLAAPLVAGPVATGMIGFVDAVLACHPGTTTLASVSVGTALFWLAMMVPMGTLMSLPPSVSQLDDANRRDDIGPLFRPSLWLAVARGVGLFALLPMPVDEIGPLFRQSLWLAVALGVVLFALLSLAVHALGPMGIAPEIRPGAAEFLRGIRWGVPALTLYYCMRYLSDGPHWTLPTMVLGFGGLLLLVPLGWVLTFGLFGLPELGAGGLGIASAIMLWVQVLAFTAYLARSKRFAPLELFVHFDRPHWATIRGLLATGLPIGVTVLMEGGLFIVTALLIGRLGEVPAAAHQIAINVASLCFMVPFGLAEATTVRVGNAVGRGRGSHGVRQAAFAGGVLVLATQLVGGSILLLGHDQFVALYTLDAVLAALASSLLLYAAAFLFPDGIHVLSAG